MSKAEALHLIYHHGVDPSWLGRRAHRVIGTKTLPDGRTAIKTPRWGWRPLLPIPQLELSFLTSRDSFCTLPPGQTQRTRSSMVLSPFRLVRLNRPLSSTHQ